MTTYRKNDYQRASLNPSDSWGITNGSKMMPNPMTMPTTYAISGGADVQLPTNDVGGPPYPAHPFAAVYPLRGETHPDWIEIVASIKTNGLLFPIVLYENQVLDGRIRQKACGVTGVEPRYIQWAPRSESDTPLQFAIDSGRRRNLTEIERIEVASNIANLTSGGAGGRTVKSVPQKCGTVKEPPITVAEAAAMQDVSPRAVSQFRQVLTHGASETVEAMRESTIPLTRAVEIAKLPVEQQPEAVVTARVDGRKAAGQRRREQNRKRDEEILKSAPPGAFLRPASQGKIEEPLLTRLMEGVKKGSQLTELAKEVETAGQGSLDLNTLIALSSHLKERIKDDNAMMKTLKAYINRNKEV